MISKPPLLKSQKEVRKDISFTEDLINDVVQDTGFDKEKVEAVVKEIINYIHYLIDATKYVTIHLPRIGYLYANKSKLKMFRFTEDLGWFRRATSDYKLKYIEDNNVQHSLHTDREMTDMSKTRLKNSQIDINRIETTQNEKYQQFSPMG